MGSRCKRCKRVNAPTVIEMTTYPPYKMARRIFQYEAVGDGGMKFVDVSYGKKVRTALHTLNNRHKGEGRMYKTKTEEGGLKIWRVL